MIEAICPCAEVAAVDSPLRITAFHVELAPAEMRAGGLHAWVKVEINHALTIDGLAVRKTRDGRTIVTWPERRGHRKVVTPKPHARVELEAAILEALGRKGALP